MYTNSKCMYGDISAGDFLPGANPLAEGPNWRQRIRFKLNINVAAGHIIDDNDVVLKL